MRIFRELLQLIGIITAVVGIVIGMCDCNGLELQISSMLIALLVFLVGCLITWVGDQLPESVRV